MRRWLSARKRDAHIFLVDRGLGWAKPAGTPGVEGLGHRGYVGRDWVRAGRQPFDFLIRQGLTPDDVVCDIGCGSLRTGVHLIPYLAPGHYLGMEAVADLVRLGLEREIGPDLAARQAPEIVVSERFEFARFSRRPTRAIAVSVFTHLNPDDIRRCLERLAAWTDHRCVCDATFFEVSRPARNYRESHPHLGFHYTRAEMASFGEASGWAADYIGDWGDAVGRQMMVRYRGPGRG